jgi:hypothetical protein
LQRERVANHGLFHAPAGLEPAGASLIRKKRCRILQDGFAK